MPNIELRGAISVSFDGVDIQQAILSRTGSNIVDITHTSTRHIIRKAMERALSEKLRGKFELLQLHTESENKATATFTITRIIHG